jgi:hypothetical protein
MPASSTTSRWPQWMHLKKMSMRLKPVCVRLPAMVRHCQPTAGAPSLPRK